MTLDSLTAVWLWENLQCSRHAMKSNNNNKHNYSLTTNKNISNVNKNNACKQALIEEEMRIEAESVECMRLPVTPKSSSQSKRKQKIDLDVMLEDEMKCLLSRKKGTINNSTGTNIGGNDGSKSPFEIKYKLLKGRRPPRPAKKVRSKASGINSSNSTRVAV